MSTVTDAALAAALVLGPTALLALVVVLHRHLRAHAYVVDCSCGWTTTVHACQLDAWVDYRAHEAAAHALPDRPTARLDDRSTQ